MCFNTRSPVLHIFLPIQCQIHNTFGNSKSLQWRIQDFQRVRRQLQRGTRKAIIRIFFPIRMHSNRTRTIRSSSHLLGECLPGGVCPGGVCPGDVLVYPSIHWGRLPCEQNDWQTGVKTLPLMKGIGHRDGAYVPAVLLYPPMHYNIMFPLTMKL